MYNCNIEANSFAFTEEVIKGREETVKCFLKECPDLARRSRDTMMGGSGTYEFHPLGSCFPPCRILHLAVHYGLVPIVELLLQHGVEVDLRDGIGQTPLHWVVNSDYAEFLVSKCDRNWKADRIEVKAEMARLLLKYHADPDARDSSGKTPRELARNFHNGDIL